MEINVVQLIDTLDEQALLYGESEAKEAGAEALRLQVTANCLRRYRDTLISIANCVTLHASHAAQNALTETGHCAHASGKFESNHEDKTSRWTCLDCGKVSEQRLVPFE